jgi:hypothetical protein
MFHRTFWTLSRFAGILLILGCFLFLTAASLTPRNEQGTYIYDLSLREGLIVTFQHWSTWQWGLILFCIAVVLTLMGFVLFATLLREGGDRAFSQMGLIAFVLAVGLLLITMAFDMSVGFWAAQETVETNAVPDLYTQMGPWSDALFNIYTALAFFAALAYGAAIVSTRLLPRWLGWVIIIYNLLGLVFFVIIGGMPPFVHYLLPIVIGSLLLLPRYQHSTVILQVEELPVVSSLVAEKHEVR